MNDVQYLFDSNQSYQLVAVMDKNGNDKADSAWVYRKTLNCIATNLRYDELRRYGGVCRMYLDFVQDGDGMWVRRRIHTSPVQGVVPTDYGLDIYTQKSIYVMEKAELVEIPLNLDRNTIALYLSPDERQFFAKGFYRDNNGIVRELVCQTHLGMFQDSCLLSFKDDPSSVLCRYFPHFDTVEFYDALNQDPLSIPLRIYNTSREYGLGVRLHGEARQIPPGGMAYIVPDRRRETE